MVLPAYSGPRERAAGDVITSSDFNNLGAGVEAALALAKMAVVTKTANFTLTGAEYGKYIEVDSASDVTVTMPPIAGSDIQSDFWCQMMQVNTGRIIMSPGSGVNPNHPPSPSDYKTRGQWAEIFVRRRTTLGSSLNLTGLVARWKADSISGSDLAVVSAWPESSGASLPNAAQVTAGNQPKLRTGINGMGGHNAVEFDGGDFLSLSGSALALAQNQANLLVFAAFQLPATAVTVGPRTLFSLSNGTSAAQNRVNLSSHIATTLFPQIGGRRLDADGFGSIAGTVALPTNYKGILTGSLQWGTNDIFLYQDGTQIASSLTFQTAGNTSNTASLSGAIGANAAGSAEFFAGKIAEILVYNVSDTANTLKPNVHSYLYGTYGGNTVPSGYTGTADQWVVTGDTSV